MNGPTFLPALAASRPDAVLLGGDVGEAHEVVSLLETLARAWSVPVYFVLGNHDFYRGSIAAVRAKVQALTQRVSNLTYLSTAAPVLLPGGTLLVGTDGWGDGGFGNAAGSKVRLNDFVFIEELRGSVPGPERLALLAELGRQSAEQLRAGLLVGLEDAEQVICLTHVPPFREATWHEGKISGDDFLPWFGCRATGEVLREVATAHHHGRRDFWRGVWQSFLGSLCFAAFAGLFWIVIIGNHHDPASTVSEKVNEKPGTSPGAKSPGN